MADRARLIGINHVAIEVGDVSAALEFYGRIFQFELREHDGSEPWIELGDQVIALFRRPEGSSDAFRHFGVVVDDLDAVRSALTEGGVTFDGDTQLDFHDPWGNRIQVERYGEARFRKDPAHLRALLSDA